MYYLCQCFSQIYQSSFFLIMVNICLWPNEHPFYFFNISLKYLLFFVCILVSIFVNIFYKIFVRIVEQILVSFLTWQNPTPETNMSHRGHHLGQIFGYHISQHLCQLLGQHLSKYLGQHLVQLLFYLLDLPYFQNFMSLIKCTVTYIHIQTDMSELESCFATKNKMRIIWEKK